MNESSCENESLCESFASAVMYGISAVMVPLEKEVGELSGRYFCCKLLLLSLPVPYQQYSQEDNRCWCLGGALMSYPTTLRILLISKLTALSI